MAETPYSQDALLREVDDAVRQDELFGFWQRYGKAIAIAIVLGLAAFGGWLFWDHHRKETSGEVAEQAQELVDAAAGGGTPDPAKLKALGDASQPGYRAMARLIEAGAAAKKGDVKGAVALYGKIHADASLAQPYRDLALLRQIAITFDTMQPQQVVDRLKPLAVEGGPWFGSAGEMTAIAYMKMGKRNLAGPIFAAVSRDEHTPATLRSRARQMAGLLGVDAVDVESSAEGAAAGQQK